jgi:hypothetical protein
LNAKSDYIMKKLRIMLLSLALFAIVGGALAFKAKFDTDYCTTNTIPDGSGGFTCPASPDVCLILENSTTLVGDEPATFCTTVAPAGGCANVVDCKTSTTLYSDDIE